MSERDSRCSLTYQRGFRLGRPCPYRAVAVIDPDYGLPFRVCGYHARAFTPMVIYPLDRPLSRVREEAAK